MRRYHCRIVQDRSAKIAYCVISMTLQISLLKRLKGTDMSITDSDWSNDVNPNGRIYIIWKISKNKWEAKYPDGSTKQFRTLKAARAYGIPKQFCQP